jgi:2-iminobutanoate/2-iminopropanoate deaminase
VAAWRQPPQLAAANTEEVMSRLQLAVLVTLVGGALAPTDLAAQETRRYIAPRTAADATLPPFSGAVQVGKTLYLSGDIGLDANNKVPDTAEGEARLLLDRIQRTLKDAGFTMDDLVFVQVFCSDVKHYDAFNKVYRTYFKKEFPARAFIGSGTLLYNARFEMQGIATQR